MNYGYLPTPYDKELAFEIKKYIRCIEADGNGRYPYVEVDGLYDGVRVRRLTHYPPKRLDEIVDKLDQIYERVVPQEYWQSL